MTLEELREWGRARGAFWAAPPRGECPGCGEENAILHEREESDGPPCCAECYKKTAVRGRMQPCDVCGEGPAFRNPAHRRDEFRCLRCHAEDGYTLDDAGMLSKLIGMSGRVHSRGRVDPCDARGHGTKCRGEVKPRGKLGVLCTFHHNPKAYT